MTILLVGGAFQGKAALAAQWGGAQVRNLHLLVRDTLQDGGDAMDLLPALLGKTVTCDELGCGVVPTDAALDAWREATGRLCCALAARAEVVARVVAGVPLVLKGELP